MKPLKSQRQFWREYLLQQQKKQSVSPIATVMVHQAIVFAGKYTFIEFDLVSTAVTCCASAETAPITGRPREFNIHTNRPVIIDDPLLIKLLWFPDGRSSVGDIPYLARSVYCKRTDANHRNNEIGVRLIVDRYSPAPRLQGD